MTATSSRPSKHWKRPATHEHYDLTVAIHKVAWRLRDVADECRDRAHRAAGTHYASPRSGRSRRDARIVARLRREARSVRRRPGRAVMRTLGRLPVIGAVFSAVRFAAWASVVSALFVMSLWWGWAKPRVYDIYQALPNPVPGWDRSEPLPHGRGAPSPFNPFGLPGGIVPGSYSSGGACVTPVGESASRPKGGVEGIAHGFGSLFRRVIDTDVTTAGVTTLMRETSLNIGRGWGMFRGSLEEGWGEPTEPTAGVSGSGLTPGATVVPAGSTDVQSFIAAIAEQESGGDYSAVGPVTSHGRAYGKYQILESNIGPWSERYLGERVSAEEFLDSPEIQDTFGHGKLAELFAAHGARGAASAWYSGDPDLHMSTATQQGGPSIKEYVDSVVGRMGSGFTTVSTQQCSPTVGGVPESGRMFGAFSNARNGGSDLGALEGLEARTGRKFDLHRVYSDWNDAQPSGIARQTAQDGRRVAISIRAGVGEGMIPWRDIAAGLHDEEIRRQAEGLASLGGTVMVGFDHEPEDAVGRQGSPEEFAAAFRQYATVMREAAPNVQTMWVMTAAVFSDPGLADAYYPGDDAVDWLAVDGYNWASCRGQEWRSFEEVFAPFRAWAAARPKPVFVAEFGSVEGAPGAKGQWLRDATATLNGWPQVKATAYFDSSRDCDWHLGTSSDALAGFAAMGADSLSRPVWAQPAPTDVVPVGNVGLCPPASAHASTERGLQPNALNVLRCGIQAFPGITTTHGVGQRSNRSYHPSGEAVDFMIEDYDTHFGNQFGWTVARWMWANREQIGITQVIWDDQIITTDRPEWRSYTHPSGASDDTRAHRDHVHVSAPGGGATSSA